jgi:hypothetical protein
MTKASLVICAAWWTLHAVASAQELPRGPVTLANGHVTLGADVSISASTNPDNVGWFNYTDYEYNALRLVRMGMTADIKANEHFAVLFDLRSENVERPRAFALYARVRPWRSRSIVVQAGRIPPVFGTFGRRAYAVDNPVIGYPLAYQYLSSLRADAIPGSAADLLTMRTRGWLADYPLGNRTPSPGVPLVNAFRWDTGVEVHVGDGPVEANVALTNGTLSNPRIADDNGGKQISARVAARPIVGLVAGVSVARGTFLARSVENVLPASVAAHDYTQRAWGFDAEYSRGYWLLRAEAIASRWQIPAIAAPFIDHPLDARSLMIEGRYKILPGVFAAARADRLTFSDVTGLRGTFPWDAPVRRIEAGGGVYLQRNAVLKLTYQRNSRDGGRIRTLNIGAAQLQVWF